MQQFQLVVVGGGSGGFGAALAAARAGLSVLLVERSPALGGNAVQGGVANWEPGVGGTAFPQEIYRRLRARPNAAAIWTMGRHCAWNPPGAPPFPVGGECILDESLDYAHTLQRHTPPGEECDVAFRRRVWHGVVFEPEAYSEVLRELLGEEPNCQVWTGWEVEKAQRCGISLQALTVRHLESGRQEQVSAPFFVDATAGVHLAAMAGCRRVMGADGYEAYGEPAAAAEADPGLVNAVTLMYRVRPRGKEGDQHAANTGDWTGSGEAGSSTGAPLAQPWWTAHWPMAHFNQMPAGGYLINMLPTMEGREFLTSLREGGQNENDGYLRAYGECLRRVHAHWDWLRQKMPEYGSYQLAWVAPALGVRETHRVRAEYTLTEHDLRAGLCPPRHEDIIAIADHPLDIHGEGAVGCPQLSGPYGIPYRCLLAADVDNLLVACRGAGFSQVAASSCRLSRTMMDLGHAAGLASAVALTHGTSLRNVPMAAVQALLKEQGATLP